MSAVAVHVCHDCDLLLQVPPALPGGVRRCPRCGAVVARHAGAHLAVPAAHALTSLILLAVTLLFPMLTLKVGGRFQESSLLTGILALWSYDMWFLTLLVAASSVVFPLLFLGGLLVACAALAWNRGGAWLVTLLRMLRFVMGWEMVGVYLLGLFVAVVKLRDMATLVYGPALFAFAALVVTSTLSRGYWQTGQLWRRLGPET
ncbi:MAG: paraquat-inducible protein A [Magnetococcus sp. WYHC-3]